MAAIPPKAEYELGFQHWFARLQGIARDTGLPLVAYANAETIQKMKLSNQHGGAPINILFHEFDKWDDFAMLSREIRKNDLFIIISSRIGYLSYHVQLDKLPHFLTSDFKENSFIIVYPQQLDVGANIDKNFDDTNMKPARRKADVFSVAGRLLKKLFLPNASERNAIIILRYE